MIMSCLSLLLTHRNGRPVFPRASRTYPVHGGDHAEEGAREGHERGHDAQGEQSQQLEKRYSLCFVNTLGMVFNGHRTLPYSRVIIPNNIF